MRTSTCGLWPARRGRPCLVAVLVDELGKPQPPLRVGRTQEDARALLAMLDRSSPGCELVLPEWLAKSGDSARLALEHGSVVWLVPAPILEAVQVVAHLATGPPARTAAALARLPLAPALRAQLRRLTPPARQQLTLL